VILEIEWKLNLLVRGIGSFRDTRRRSEAKILLVREVEVKRASFRALAKDSALGSGGKVPLLSRCAL